MVERIQGKRKLTPAVRARLAALAAEARELVYGEAGYPVWGTLFSEMEEDAREVGFEFIRQLLQQAAQEQGRAMPREALDAGSGEEVQSLGTAERTLETEYGPVHWQEPKAYLPKSRKAFFPSVEDVGPRS